MYTEIIREGYTRAVEREVAEEVIVEADHTDKIVALLNDDSNEVGQVHRWALDEPKVERREQMITQMSFMTIDQLREVRDTMETWSSLCLDGLSKMT